MAIKLKIYQINCDRDTKFIKFLNLERAQKTAHIDEKIYDRVFMGEVNCNDLEEVYTKFNTESHPLMRGHSLSVSDVVVANGKAYYCDSVGFKEIDFDENKVPQDPLNQYTVVFVEPHMKPYEAEIGADLKHAQKAVGGLIEIISNNDNTLIVCNDEGKLLKMDGNRHIAGTDSIIAGSFFIVGDDGENFCSLTDEQVKKYLEVYGEVENISDDEVQNDMNITVISM